MQCGKQSKDDAGQERNANGKCDNSPIDDRQHALNLARIGQPGNVPGDEQEQTSDTPCTEQKSKDAAKARQDYAFGE